MLSPEGRCRELLEALPAAVYTTDAAGRITFYNQAAADLWGQRPELGTSEWCGSWKLYWPDGTPLRHEHCPMAVALKENRPVRRMEAVAERPDGTRAPFIPYPTPIYDQRGALVGAVNMLVDITERKKAEDDLRARDARLERANKDLDERVRDRTRELAENAALLQATLDTMDQGLMMVDADGRVPVCNQRAIDLLDLPDELMRSTPPFKAVLRHQLERSEFVKSDEAFHRWVETTGFEHTAHVYERERPDGTVLEIRSMPLPHGGFVRTYTDITARKEAERRVEHMARHDGLTDLANRALFREHLVRRLAEVNRYGGSAALLCIDLDRFKAVNDTMGHPAGDELLRALSLRMKEMVRTEDTVARLGGDEFAILQVGVDQPTNAGALAQHLLEIARQPIRIGGSEVTVELSIGIAIAPGDGLDPDDLLKRADLALYRAKSEGRNTFRFYEAAMDEAVQARQRLELDLRGALAKGELEVFYQPPFDKIKIDRSFIQHIGNPDTAAIVQAIVALAGRLGTDVTAEGVETQEQFERVREEGCTEVQGYLVSRPRPAQEIPMLLGSKRSCVVGL